MKETSAGLFPPTVSLSTMISPTPFMTSDEFSDEFSTTQPEDDSCDLLLHLLLSNPPSPTVNSSSFLDEELQPHFNVESGMEIPQSESTFTPPNTQIQFGLVQYLQMIGKVREIWENKYQDDADIASFIEYAKKFETDDDMKECVDALLKLQAWLHNMFQLDVILQLVQEKFQDFSQDLVLQSALEEFDSFLQLFNKDSKYRTLQWLKLKNAEEQINTFFNNNKEIFANSSIHSNGNAEEWLRNLQKKVQECIELDDDAFEVQQHKTLLQAFNNRDAQNQIKKLITETISNNVGTHIILTITKKSNKE